MMVNRQYFTQSVLFCDTYQNESYILQFFDLGKRCKSLVVRSVCRCVCDVWTEEGEGGAFGSRMVMDAECQEGGNDVTPS